MTEENLGSFYEEIIEDKTFRNWMILLYDQSDNYVLSDILFNISSLKNYAIIKHDPEMEEKQQHFHVYLELSSATTQERLAKRLGVPQNYLKRVKSRRGAVRYLTHIDYPNKIQYPIDSVKVSRSFQRTFLKCYEDLKTEEEILQDIYNWIDNSSFADFFEKLRYFTLFINMNCYDTIYKRYRYELMEYLKRSIN